MTHACRARLLSSIVLSLGVGCAGEPPRQEPPAGDEFGAYRRPHITAATPAVHRLVEQGLVLAYGFDHDRALAAFREATQQDPGCAMAWWGIAYANGPHINLPVQLPDRAVAALDAVAKARACAKASVVERALIEAVATRYSTDPAAERAALDTRYAEAMAGVWASYPQDADVGALHAESLMNVHPWDLWTSAGEPKHDVLRIVAVLDATLALAPDHPMANHLYIHALEASPEPGRADAAANRLRGRVPASSHLLHMPSHIDIRRGRFTEAADCNIAAIRVDEQKAAATSRTGFYQVYMAHNRHMLAFVSMMEGRYEDALAAARGMVATVPPEFVAENGPVIDGYLAVALHVLVRFGKWEEVLAEPAFPPALRAANAVRSYARGVSLTALGRTDEAALELAALRRAVADMDDRPMGNNLARAVLQVPLHLLAGELLLRQGETDAGLVELRAAVAAEDAFVYDEPPDWMMPARHTLAAALLVLGKPADAEPLLQSDLRRFPGNVWSLAGLAQCLRARNAPEVRQVEVELARARERADTRIETPCLCQRRDH